MTSYQTFVLVPVRWRDAAHDHFRLSHFNLSCFRLSRLSNVTAFAEIYLKFTPARLIARALPSHFRWTPSTGYDAPQPTGVTMKKRSRAGGELTKVRRGNAPEPKGRNAVKALARSNSPPTNNVDESARLARELGEALDRQTATTELLQAINNSHGDLQPVFQTMLAKAVRLCQATFGVLWLAEGDRFRSVALHNLPPAFAAARQREPIIYFGPKSGTGRLIEKKQIFQIDDLTKDPGYIERDPRIIPLVELGGARTALFAPLLKENHVVGSLVLYRQEVCPFGDKQIALVENFAAQAVIAIENARLLNELRQSLEQQTATGEILSSMSGSIADTQPAFNAIVRNLLRLFGTRFATIMLLQDGMIYLPAVAGEPGFERLVDLFPRPISDESFSGRAMLLKEPFQFAPLVDNPAVPPFGQQTAREFGYNSVVFAPMIMGDKVVGAIGTAHREAKPFSEQQVALLRAFADQAVIAIENARLLNELRQRTHDLTERTGDLTEALEQQTATSKVLQVISSSPGDLEPVFATMLENAVRICEAKFGNIYRWNGNDLTLIATHNTPAALAETRKRSPILRFGRKNPVARMIDTKTVVHVEDAAVSEAYIEHDPAAVESVDLGGTRTFVAVPMLKEDELVGAFALSRQEVRPFTDKQIELVKNFAAQAVIAIENARLLNELRQSLEQQTATSEVLEVISSSPGDLEPVFASMLQNAVRICDATFGNIYRWDGTHLHLVASHNAPPAYVEYRKQKPFRADNPFAVARMINSKAPVHVTDLGDEAYAEGVQLAGIKTFLAVPMLKDDNLVGAFIVSRKQVRPFTDKQIALVHNFAAQAVIAIENTRLLKELRDRTEQVEKLNQHLEQRVADQVGEIERMGRLRRFLPPQVADLIVASGSEKQLESHRREITALFCDLRGFTGFTQSADAEDVMALLRDYHAAIGEIIIKYNGTLERYAGDGVMVIFNDPVPVENPALQAVLMAPEVRDAIGALTKTWRRLGHDIGFGIGIAHGFATLGTIGFEGRFDYAAIGTVSNVASRLCDEAKPGQILISPRVLMNVENAVKVEPVGEFELKGIRRPLAAYNVVGVVSQT